MKYWGIVPAAGRGTRFAGDHPKQYNLVAGAPVLEHSIRALLRHPDIETVVVAVSADDRYWNTCTACNLPGVRRVTGGDTRAASVYCALRAISDEAGETDWVLVHDGVRPCLSYKDLCNLIVKLTADRIGGVLTVPMTDTVKQTDGDIINRTISREDLVRSVTPQMFRYAILCDALRNALEKGQQPGDESEAVEQTGHTVRFVTGAGTNIKISYEDDLPLAEAILSERLR